LIERGRFRDECGAKLAGLGIVMPFEIGQARRKAILGGLLKTSFCERRAANF